MKRLFIGNLIPLAFIVIAISIFVSCNKKDESPSPNILTLNANPDSVHIYDEDKSIVVSILANDSYNDIPTILTDSVYVSKGTVIINGDRSITFTPKSNFYGTTIIRYTLQDATGSTSGNIIVKRGTDAQIRTCQRLESVGVNSLLLFAIDHDTSNIYSYNYYSYRLRYSSYNDGELIIDAPRAIMPNIGRIPHKILPNGKILAADNANNFSFEFEVAGLFSAEAKKYDGTSTMNVSGITIIYNGHSLDYATQLPCEFVSTKPCY